MTATILDLTVLSDDTDDRVFSLTSDWTDECGLNWPEDAEVKARLEAELGRQIDRIEFVDSGDHPQFSEGIYRWTETTIAAEISDRFDDDGQTFEDDDGIEFLTVCDDAAIEKYTKDGCIIFKFSDGSYIAVTDNYWDIIQIEDGEFIDSNSEMFAVCDLDGSPLGWTWRIPGL